MSKASVKVKKYGGTSIATVDRIRRVAQDVVEEHREGVSQLVVVSAMGKTTDVLVDMARRITRKPRAREMDLLLTTGEQVSIALMAMAVHELGVKATALTGGQCGIVTDGNFSRARIQGIDSEKILQLVQDGNVVIVAGFQGVTSDQEITSLGRGGSDTTAAALAAALGSPKCEIYTDVDGVFTADPRIVPDARLLPLISYEEMLEYAASGSAVLHPRCVEISNRYNVPLEVRSSLHHAPGTTMLREDALEKVAITGVTGDAGVARVAVTQVHDVPGVAARISGALADAGIAILLIIQGIRHDQTNDFSLIVSEEDAERCHQILEGIVHEVGAKEVKIDAGIAKVSVIGSGVASTPSVAAGMFRALAERGINIELISSSEVRIACIIRQEQLEAAIRAIHEEFDLGHLERRRLPNAPEPHSG